MYLSNNKKNSKIKITSKQQKSVLASRDVILVVDREKEFPEGKTTPAVLHQEEDGKGEADQEADEAEEGDDLGGSGGPDGGRDQGIGLAHLRLTLP